MHDAVLHFEGAEAHIHGDGFHHIAVFVGSGQIQGVQIGNLGAPLLHGRNGGSEGQIFGSSQDLGVNSVAVGIFQGSGDGAGQVADDLGGDVQTAIGVAFVQLI